MGQVANVWEYVFDPLSCAQVRQLARIGQRMLNGIIDAGLPVPFA